MTTNNTTFSHNDTDMRAELAELRETVSQLHSRSEQAERHYCHATRRARLQIGLAFTALIGATLLSPGNRAAIAQGYGVTLQQLATRMTAAETNISKLQARATALEGKTQFMTADATGKWTIFSGCNLYIRNGLGATNGNPANPSDPKAAITNGLGNLIIGYNMVGNFRGDTRTGSHNLVLGDFNSYTSFGGAIMGFDNMISGSYATITGGAQSLASGSMSSVGGGLSNETRGNQSFACGGQNLASGIVSCVTGGLNNVASGDESTISGGFGITQNNNGGWSGGSFHTP